MLWRPTHKVPSLLPSVYVATFFLSLHYSIGLYVDAGYLLQYFKNGTVNILYMLGSLGTIIALSLIPKILQKYGNYALTIAFAMLEILSLVCLAFLKSPLLISLIFIFHISAVAVLSYNLDIFVENNSVDETTGETRGLFLTIMNTAVFLGPVMAGFLLSGNEFWKVYLASALLVVPALFIVIKKLKSFADPLYKRESLSEMFSLAWKNKNIRFISISNFLLQFFYSWMVIYMATYLSEVRGFTWQEIGIIFGFMLLPFIFLQYPLGEIADKRYGEKEILILGFLVTGISTMMLTFLGKDSSLLLWSLILFVTRIGAASIEIMTESYFFKQIEASDMGLISFFRHTRPIAFIFGAGSASIFLTFIDIKYLFLTLGVVMFSGIYFGYKIIDTK